MPEPWSTESVEAALRDAVERSGMKAKQVFQPLRVALTGTHRLARDLRDGRAGRAGDERWPGSTPRSTLRRGA